MSSNNSVSEKFVEEAPVSAQLAGLVSLLQKSFPRKGPVSIVRSPYRICPLGAHIDHQGGVVLGIALNRGVYFLWYRRKDSLVRVLSSDYGGEALFKAGDLPESSGSGKWSDYLAASIWALRRQGLEVRSGLQGVVSGELPVGGLSSSAACSLAYGVALRVANEFPLEAWALAEAAVKGENGYVGVSCGLLDPVTITFAEKRSLLVIDCACRQVRQLPAPESLEPFAIAVVFSGVKRSLVSSSYNKRVSECRRAAEVLSRAAALEPPASRLGEIPPEVYRSYSKGLPDALRRRAEHFFSESERVRRGTEAWCRGDVRELGELMNRSGESSIIHYQAGSPQIIALWEILRTTEGVYGTRFSGGGFGGAVVALVDPEKREQIASAVRSRYLGAHPECKGGFQVHFLQSASGLRYGRIEQNRVRLARVET